MNAIVKQEGHALASAQSSGRMAVADIINHVATVQEVMRAVMKPDVHYGKIPGTDKPTLYKAGAEVLCMVFRIAASYEVEDLSTADTVRYRVTCTGTHQITGTVLGTGMGESSSGEEKYKWRKATSPQEFDETPVNMRRTKHVKPRNSAAFSIQQVRTEPADLANTILKMANKRANMAMVLNVTAASDCFAQDLEDMDEALRDHLARRGDEAGETAQPASAPATPTAYPQADFDRNLPAWTKAINGGKKTADEVIAMVETKGALTDQHKATLRAIPGVQDATPKTTAAEPTGDGPKFTYAELADQIVKATGPEGLDSIKDLARHLPEDQQAELAALVQKRAKEIGLTN